MPLTTPDGIYYRDTSSPASLETESATQATSIQNALSNREIQTYKWANATERGSQTGMTEGDVGDQADTNQRWRYSGSAWVNVTTGLVPIIPTSVAGAGVTLGADGVVTFTGATTVNVNGVFAAGKRYRVFVQSTNPTAQDTLMRLRLAGTDATAASSYGNQRNYGTGTSLTSGGEPTDKWYLSAGANGKVMSVIELWGAADAAPTIGTGMATAANSASAMYATTLGLYHNASTAYDGFTLYIGSGTWSGTVRVEELP